MIGTSELTRYGVRGTFATMVALLMALTLSLLQVGSAYAQSNCDEAKQRIYRITDTRAQQVPDSLQTVLDLVAFVRGCEEDVSQDLETWLLMAEVFVLDKLGRLEEAMSPVDRFFDAYFDEASDYHKARFYLWRLHLKALAGDGMGTVKDYLEAKQYADALEPTHQAHLHLNGAYAFRTIREYEVALRLTEEAKTLLTLPQAYEDSVALARATHAGAEVRFLMRLQLQQVMEDLQVAATLYGALGDTSKVAAITTLLGETYAAEGDTSLALSEMATGVLLADKAGSARSKVYAFYRQGQLLRKWGDLDAAEQSLLQAMEASEAVGEFYIRTAYELALLAEDRHEIEQATSYYQTVIDAPNPRNFVAALQAQQKKQDAQIRLLLIENDRTRTRYYFALSGLFIVLGGGVVLFLFFRRRIPTLNSPPPSQPAGTSIAKKKSNGDFIPRKMPTGLTLDELEQRFREAVDSKKLGGRLAWIYAILLDIELILPYITDEYLAGKVEAYNVGNNAELFKCVAAIEEERTNEAFTGRAENTLASYLRGEFDKRPWLWPKHPVVWKLHFIEYHVEMLFKKEDDDLGEAVDH